MGVNEVNTAKADLRAVLSWAEPPSDINNSMLMSGSADFVQKSSSSPLISVANSLQALETPSPNVKARLSFVLVVDKRSSLPISNNEITMACFPCRSSFTRKVP